MSAFAQHVKEMMGHQYMQLHSIGYGPSVQLEDAKTALRAYWRLAEQRFHTNSTAAIEQVLLLKGSQYIERVLLELVNNEWGSSAGGVGFGTSADDTNDSFSQYCGLSLSELLAEDPTVVKERTALTNAKTKYEAALKRMESVATLRMK
jgi:hypothetical protein